MKAQKLGTKVDYVGIEAYPVSMAEVQQLDYITALNAPENEAVFQKMHECLWSERVQLSSQFFLTKQKMNIQDILFKNRFDLIYFDAFGPRVQPELWTEDIFLKMYNCLKKSGWLTTYSAKGDVRRAMQAVGFQVERAEGPPGKREMLVAQKS